MLWSNSSPVPPRCDDDCDDDDFESSSIATARPVQEFISFINSAASESLVVGIVVALVEAVDARWITLMQGARSLLAIS